MGSEYWGKQGKAPEKPKEKKKKSKELDNESED